jgi:hypothetical protein
VWMRPRVDAHTGGCAHVWMRTRARGPGAGSLLGVVGWCALDVWGARVLSPLGRLACGRRDRPFC